MTGRPALGDIAVAASLLTRLPVPVDHARAGARMAAALWAAPVVGAALGAMTGVVLLGALAIGLPPLAAAAVAVAAALWLTGALHEDGFADCADGFGGGHTVARRLEIMRDSRLGTYGVAALTLALLVRVVLLAELAPAQAVAVCAVAGAASRVPMVWALRLLPSARDTGLGAGAGVPPRWAAWLALGLVAGQGLLWPQAMGALGAALMAALLMGLLARRAIGGQTGDVLGAMQVVGELAALAVLASGSP